MCSGKGEVCMVVFIECWDGSVYCGGSECGCLECVLQRQCLLERVCVVGIGVYWVGIVFRGLEWVSVREFVLGRSRLWCSGNSVWV